MKMPFNLLLLAAFLLCILQMSCSGDIQEEQDLYLSKQMSSLRQNFSDLDKSLSSLKEMSAGAFYTHFRSSLRKNHLSENLIDKMTDLLQASDKAFDGPAYHGPEHTAHVGNVTSWVLDTASGNGLTEDQKILLIVAALFHDIDPLRALGTPPKVEATFDWIDKNPDALAFFDALLAERHITKNQIKTVIKYTDFHIDPNKRAIIKSDADNMAENNFDSANADIVKIWGPRVAYFDKVANYSGSYHFAQWAVFGLAHEFRAEKAHLKLDSKSPTDIEVLSDTAKFLTPLLNDPTWKILPPMIQDNFTNVQASFEKYWSGKKQVTKSISL